MTILSIYRLFCFVHGKIKQCWYLPWVFFSYSKKSFALDSPSSQRISICLCRAIELPCLFCMLTLSKLVLRLHPDLKRSKINFGAQLGLESTGLAQNLLSWIARVTRVGKVSSNWSYIKSTSIKALRSYKCWWHLHILYRHSFTDGVRQIQGEPSSRHPERNIWLSIEKINILLSPWFCLGYLSNSKSTTGNQKS